MRRRLGLQAFKGSPAVLLADRVAVPAAVAEGAAAVKAEVEVGEAGSASSKDLLLTLERIW